MDGSFRSKRNSFIKLLIYISVLHTRCYPSDDVALSVLLVVAHVTLFTLLLILPNQVDYGLSFQVTSVVKCGSMKDALIRLNASIKFQIGIACFTAKKFPFDGINNWCPVRVVASNP